MNLKDLQKIPRYIWVSAISVLVITSLYGGSYGIIQNQLNKEQEGPDFDLLHFFITDVTNEAITVDLNFSLSEPVNNKQISFDLRDLKLYNNETQVAEISTNPSTFIASQTSFRVNVTFHIVSEDIYSLILNDMFKNGYTLLDLRGKIKLGSFFTIFPKFTLDKQLNISKSENITRKDIMQIQISDYDINEENLTYAFFGNLSITNPFEFPINITGILGKVSFDDPDGYVFGITVKEEYDIQLTRVDLDWTNSPMILLPNTTATKAFQIQDNILTALAIPRLIDEVAKGRLYLNFNDAQLDLEIAGSSWNIPFDLQEINLTF